MSQVLKTAGEAIFSIDILGCAHCTAVMETELRDLAGILSVDLNNVAGTLRVSFDPSKTTSDAIRYYLKGLCQAAKPTTQIARSHPKPRRVS